MKNPILNAILAGGYIAGIVLVMNLLMSLGQEGDGEDVILIPMTMLSLFTLSAAVMGYLFAATPIRMYLDGQKGEAFTFFLKTLGAFAVITAAFVLALLAYYSLPGV